MPVVSLVSDVIGTEVQLALKLLGQKYSWHCNYQDRNTAGTVIVGTEVQLALRLLGQKYSWHCNC